MAAGFPTKNNWIAGDVLTASAMDDLGTTVNYTQYHTPRNVVLNSAFDVWQKATSFAIAAAQTDFLTADRWFLTCNGTGMTSTISRQAFTLGTAPVAGQENAYYYRYAQTVAATGQTSNYVQARIEDVRTFAGQTVTLSFWAKADTANTVTPSMVQYFGTGGSPSANVITAGSAISITTSWVRYTQTFAIPSIAGKVIGTGSSGLTSSLRLQLAFPNNATGTFDIWGVQLEKGSYANEYFRNGTNAQAELAACQRFAYGINGTGTQPQPLGVGQVTTTSNFNWLARFPVPMITTPTYSPYINMTVGNYRVLTWNGSSTSSTSAPTAVGPTYIDLNGAVMSFTTGATLTVGTNGFAGLGGTSFGTYTDLFWDTAL